MGLVRGDVTIVALSGDYGKPRPAVVVQSDLFQDLASVVVVPMTSDLRTIPALFRIRIEPTEGNGLILTSDVMVDKMSVVLRSRLGIRIGRFEPEQIAELSAALALFLGF